MAADRDISAADSLLRIEINPALPCGIAECGCLARYARIERDRRYESLWRLLPICDVHLASLDAAAADIAATVGAAPAGAAAE